MARFPILLTFLAGFAICSFPGTAAWAEPWKVGTQPAAPDNSQPSSAPQPGGLMKVALPQDPRNPPAADIPPRKPPRIWLFMGFGS
jgi:hypothetical protein